LALRISKKVKENTMKKKRKGFTLVELLVVIAIIALLMGILMPALARVRQIAFRMVCGSNLSGLGRAMLIYANDYDNDFPRPGFVGTIWDASVINWAAADRATAYGNPGQATITSTFYLLVKYAEVTPKSFICKGEPAKVAFKASDYIPNFEDEDAWDFGPYDTGQNRYPTNHCSYSYHMPFNQCFLSTASSEPGMAVAADRNPFLDPFTYSNNFDPFNYNPCPDPYQDLKYYQMGNAGAHQREGQNVLFMDNHVYFEKESFCGVDDDNIYTSQDTSGSGGIPKEQGIMPVCDAYDTSVPINLKDSLLVNECGPAAGTGTVVPPPPPPPPPPP
jgi:prepilin-type N-terminal cleavage/methylation domain-containing protein